ncbi:M56 family metallopeptidase [Paenibacillus azoreducens]|uniref:M56 family metallopeptidase n=1 Tax=Paenibacillus azoreducens TaxID=116718 RepID=UPI0039F60EAA
MDAALHTSLLSFFGWLIRGSFMAGILVLLVLIVQFILKNKLEARWKYLLWMPVVIRLLLPWAPESSLSLYNVLSLEAIVPGIHGQSQSPDVGKAADRATEAAVYGERSLNLETSGIVEVSAPNRGSGTEQERRFWWSEFKEMSFINILMLVWLAGALLLAAKTVYDQLRLKQALRAGRPIDIPLLTALFHETKQQMGVKRQVRFLASERLPGPAVIGFRKPVVVISPNLLSTLQKGQLQYILAHEFAHIRRRDVVVNWVMHIILILHWFNPFIWLAVYKARQDQEMACDACALDRLSSQQSSAYGQTIIHVLEHFSGRHHQPGLAGLSSTHKQMKKRLLMIKHFHNKSYHLSILGMTVILVLSGVTLVNAKGDGARSEPQAGSIQLNQDSQESVKDEPDQSSSGEIKDSSEKLAAEELTYEEALAKARKEREEALKALTAEEKKFIDDEKNRLKELVKDSDDTYVTYHKYKKLNSGLDLSFWGLSKEYSTYEDYSKKTSALQGPILQQPDTLPEGYLFSHARIESPTEGEFFEELRAEGRKSDKPVYTKKLDWKEPGRVELRYTDGKDELIINQYTADEEFAKLKGTEFSKQADGRKYFFQYGTGKYYYGISTKSDMSQEKMNEILKAAVLRNNHFSQT